MRDKNAEVNRADRTLGFERHRADLEMIGEIRDQEKGGARDGRQHAEPVGAHALRLDQEISGDQEEGAERVQRRVDRRKLRGRNQWGKMSGSNIRIRNTQSTNGARATTAKVFLSNLRCMKCIATKAAFHTARIMSKMYSRIFGKPR